MGERAGVQQHPRSPHSELPHHEPPWEVSPQSVPLRNPPFVSLIPEKSMIVALCKHRSNTAARPSQKVQRSGLKVSILAGVWID